MMHFDGYGIILGIGTLSEMGVFEKFLPNFLREYQIFVNTKSQYF